MSSSLTRFTGSLPFPTPFIHPSSTHFVRSGGVDGVGSEVTHDGNDDRSGRMEDGRK